MIILLFLVYTSVLGSCISLNAATNNTQKAVDTDTDTNNPALNYLMKDDHMDADISTDVWALQDLGECIDL